MSFHLGRPILLMCSVALVAGAAMLLRPPRQAADLTVWVFADSHARTYEPLLPEFQRATGRSAAIDLISSQALNIRLTSLFLSGGTGETPPDAVEVEIGAVGRLFRPPPGEVGFLPLNDRLENTGWREIDSLQDFGRRGHSARLRSDGLIYTHDGARWTRDPSRKRPDAWIDRILRSRLAPWSKQGVIFGLPHDVHPVTLTYRQDLFEEAGIDLASATTWEAFQDKCLAFQQYWRGRGYPDRYALELPLASADYLVAMLLQRGINLVDDSGRIYLTDRRVVETVLFYAQLVTGPRKIATDVAGGAGVWTNDLRAGNVCGFFTPDWRVADVRRFAPDLRGKVRMMPLPRFEPGDARTSTWGGTMIGIPRHAKNPDLSWKLIEHLYLSEVGLAERRKTSGILSPLPEEWDRPEYHQPDPFFGGQRVMELYAELALEIPPRYVTPSTTLATAALSYVLANTTEHLRLHGTPGVNAACERWLEQAQSDVQRRLQHASFD